MSVLLIQSDHNCSTRVSYAANDAHCPPQHGLAAAMHAAFGRDRRTWHRFNTLTAYRLSKYKPMFVETVRAMKYGSLRFLKIRITSTF